jgi:hypothetical protein
MNELTTHDGFSPVWLIAVAVAALFALWLAFKIAHFIIKLICGLFVLAASAGVVWWFFLRR